MNTCGSGVCRAVRSSVDDRPVFADGLEIQPGLMNADATGFLERHRYIASGFWYGVPPDATITPAQSGALIAFDRCASREQVFLRALARDGCEMTTTLQSAVDAINAAWGLEPIPIKRFTS